jgi:hypothetical protein
MLLLSLLNPPFTGLIPLFAVKIISGKLANVYISNGKTTDQK